MSPRWASTTVLRLVAILAVLVAVVGAAAVVVHDRHCDDLRGRVAAIDHRWPRRAPTTWQQVLDAQANQSQLYRDAIERQHLVRELGSDGCRAPHTGRG